jgi:hypothetical protein
MSASDETYVTNAAWLRLAGRVDHVDEIADQFERPTTEGAEALWPRGRADFWVSLATAGWPRMTGGLRSATRLHSPQARTQAQSAPR